MRVFSLMNVKSSFLIVSAFLIAEGGFGLGVQCFALIQPCASSSISRLVHNANSAFVCCNGRIAPYCCNTWMGCTSAAAARSNAWKVNPLYQSTHARSGVSLLPASSSCDDRFSPEPLTSVWVQLYIDYVKAGCTTQVTVDHGANVDDLTKLVKQEFTKTLVGITAADLMVYAWNDEHYTSSLRRDIKIDDHSLYGGDTLDRPIRVTARTPNKVVIPPGVNKWGVTCDDKEINFADFAKASRDVFYNIVDPTTEKLIRDEGSWSRSSELEAFAASLVGHHRAMEKLLVRINGSSRDEKVKEDETEVVDGCTARYLGANVIALELPRNPVEAEDSSKTSPTVLSRSNVRTIVNKTIEVLKSGDSVFVIGQEGIGNTRSCLLGCLALLLSERAPVLYMSGKTSRAYLFIPNPDTSRYLVWINVDYVTSRLTGDARMIVLMDPPESKGYRWGFTARLVKVCSNDHELHFRNADKFAQIRFLYPEMPKLEEVFAMAKVLWSDASSHFVGKTCKDNSEIMNILAMRSFLVGCAPRYIFDLAKYIARLQTIQISATEVNRERAKKSLFGCANGVEVIHGSQNLAPISNKLYNLDGVDIVYNLARPKVSLNGYARNCLLKQLTAEPLSPEELEQFVEEYLLIGGTFGMMQFTFGYPVPDIAKNSKTAKKAKMDVMLAYTMEKIVLPPRTRFEAKIASGKSPTDHARQTIQKLPQGYVYSTRQATNIRAINFATSPSEWWNVQSVPKCDVTTLLEEMQKQGLKNVTATIVTLGTVPDCAWPFEGSSESMTQSTWDLLKGVTIRFWSLDNPSAIVNVGLLADQCKDGIFNVSLSQVTSLKLPQLVASVHAATTGTIAFEALSVALSKTKSSGSGVDLED